MASEAHTIHVEDGSELGRLLDRMDEAPLRLEKNGVIYRISREDDLWAGYDVDLARQGLRASIGAFDGVDVEELLSDLRAQRGQDSSGRPAGVVSASSAL